MTCAHEVMASYFRELRKHMEVPCVYVIVYVARVFVTGPVTKTRRSSYKIAPSSDAADLFYYFRKV